MISTYSLADMNNTVLVTNEAGEFSIGKNLVVYHGADIVAGCLAGLAPYKISHIAFEYENTAGTPSPAAAARTDTVASALLALSGNFDYLRAPLSASPLITSGGANYVGNQVTFTATSTATVGAGHALAFSAGSNSKIYAVSLLAAVSGVNTGDVMFARYILGTPLAAVGAGQVNATWTVVAN